MELDVDYIVLTEEEETELLQLSALNYSVDNLALYFDKELKKFKHDALTEGCKINRIIRRGKLIARANPDMKLFESAESGNITAIQQLAKRMKESRYTEMLNELYDEDEDSSSDTDNEL